MAASPKTTMTWPRGWTAAGRQEWAGLGLDVRQARLFHGWGWAPTATLRAVSALTPAERAALGGEGLTILPGRDVRTVLALHGHGVSSSSAEWDAAALDLLTDEAVAPDVASRLDPSNDPALALLGTLHEVDTDAPLDVALARHAETGCSCATERFEQFVGTGRLPVADDVGLIRMLGDDAQTADIRTGHYLAARVDDGPWVRMPDLLSACWYLRTQTQGLPEEVAGDFRTALQCVQALGRLDPERTELELLINGMALTWNGWAVVPSDVNDVPDELVVTEFGWDGDDSSPGTSGYSTLRLIVVNDEYFVGGDEMPWEDAGPFTSQQEAISWFDATWGEGAMAPEDDA